MGLQSRDDDFNDPVPFLQWIAEHESLDLSTVKVPEVWALAALATLARREAPKLEIRRTDSAAPSCRIAHAVGMAVRSALRLLEHYALGG